MSATFEGRVSLVTGASRGIGKTIATHLSDLGAAVAIVDRDVDRGDALARRLRADGRRAEFVPADLSKPAEARRAVEDALSLLGRIDILVNNAASHGRLTSVLDMGLDEWNEVIGTNLTGTFFVSQAAARAMIPQGGGVIINLLAIQSQLPISGYGPYCVSKGGLDALTRVLAVELAGTGIRVNGIVVGSVYSESVRAVLPPELAASDDLEVVPSVLDESAATLVGRMGRPSDIARVVTFLASDDAAYLTGTLLAADGGRQLSRRPDPLIPRKDRR
ncbi:MAG TPA: SDR family oxidoreductase [bacterium]|nr:SDR family oxidoreductase [bacterium]